MGYGRLLCGNGILLAAALLLPGLPALGQKNALVFWEPDPAKVDPILLASPKNDAERFSLLRRAFLDFHCSERLEEQRAGKQDENLVCTVPGKSAATILILARYDKRDRDRPTWPDALMLPLLFHALQAQPRDHTFVFAVLGRDGGEKCFFARRAEGAEKPPVASIVLDSLGMGLPNMYTEDGLVYQEAQQTAALLGITVPMYRPGYPENRATNSIYASQWRSRILDSSLARKAGRTPMALFYSDPSRPVNAAAFHEDFDFLAWFLCGLDVTLQPAEPVSSR